MNEQTPNPNATNKEINEQAAVSSLPVSPEAKAEVVTEVQPEVQKETDSQAADKRKQVLDEAVSALALTKSALAALDEKESARALATLAEVISASIASLKNRNCSNWWLAISHRMPP